MTKNFRTAINWLRSDNPKAAPRTTIQKRPYRPKSVALLAFALAFALCWAVAHAQQTEKIFRIGFLDGGTAAGSAVLVKAFLQELRKLGWIRERVLPSSTDLPSKSLSACLSSRRN